MPISESLQLNFETEIPAETIEKHLNTRVQNLDAAVNCYYDEYQTKNDKVSVFMDASNPLLAQVAIFARLLEMSDKQNGEVLANKAAEADV